jgi:hypothetical protein
LYVSLYSYSKSFFILIGVSLKWKKMFAMLTFKKNIEFIVFILKYIYIFAFVDAQPTSKV